MANLPTGAKVFNVVRANMNEVYMSTLPAATADNIQTLSGILFNDMYQPMLNEFVGTLINRIGLTRIENKSFSNPLSIFKKGSVPLGTDIQVLYENPAEAETYALNNTEMAKLLTITDPDTHVAYFRRNRQDLYTKTIARESLQAAFVSWDKFEDYITSITNSLYSGNYIDEFEYTKDLINSAYKQNKIVIEPLNPSTPEQQRIDIITKLRELYLKMTMPSTKYNAYTRFSGAKGQIKTWTESERICVIVGADLMSSIDVNVLASAFNMDKATFLGRVVVVDELAENLLAVICDESWLQIYDNLMRFDEFYNARTMSWNEYLHVWGTYAISPFANAVALSYVVPDIPSTQLSFETNSTTLSLSSVPNYETFELQLTPANTTDDVTFTTTGSQYYNIEKIDERHVKVTPKAAGSGNLVAKTTSGKTATLAITVEA